jgi:TonB-linked SusC/RagA family outer membrane protein
MKKKYIKVLIFFSFVVFFTSTGVVAQNRDKADQVTIESIVKDEKGNPINGAVIYGNEGSVITKTNTSGRFSITVSGSTDLLIQSDGYESVLLKPEEYRDQDQFVLKSSPYLLGEKDEVNVAFGKVKQGDLVNAVSVINADEIREYDNAQTISEALLGRVPGLLGTSNIRGIGNALFIVDGLPRDINTINLAEVDQISVLKDINSSILYGSAAVNGVVLVTTKRGKPNKKEVKVSGHYGVSTPTALPKYLSSADYMELYNEARVNDGLTPQYDPSAIANYRSGNIERYANTDYYSSQYLKNVKPFFRLMTELSGGNDKATYYANLGWDQSGSLLNFGEGKNAKENRFNARGNVDMKINDWISSSLDAVAVFDNDKGPVGNYWADASTLQPNLFSPLIPISRISPENELLKGRKNDLDGIYLLGGTSSYLTNPIANGYSGGVNENIQRTFSFNNRVNFDLSQVAEGLAFHTNISFDFYSRYNQSINNSYSVYEPTWNAAGDSIINLQKYGNDSRSGNQNIGNPYYQRRIGFYGMLDYDRTFGEDHHVTASVLGYGNTYKYEADDFEQNLQGDKNANLGLRLGYGYKNKYLVDFSSAYVNSVKLPEGNRGAFSPSLGLAWVISSEDFMSSVSPVNYLKLKVSGGVLNSDAGIDGFYYYDNVYNLSGGYYWYEGTWQNNGTVSSYGGNNQLGFEKRSEFNIGVEGLFFNRMLSLDANVFTSAYSGLTTRPSTQYPGFYTDFIPYENFDKNSYNGAELALAFNKNFGNVSVSLGANALYATSEVLKRDEVYVDKYRYRKGNPVDAMYGLVADGLFMDNNDIANHGFQAFGNVQPGDIKYVDQNNDGIIDANDEVYIGRSQAPFSYGLNLRISYKSFTLFALGTGRAGADSYINGSYYWVDGNDKYSEYVINRWTENTKATATFPRLSSLSNSNNFRNSTFWLYRNNYFTLNTLQATYGLPKSIANALKMKQLDFYLNASNLLTVSKHNDIRNLNVGSEPFYRSFSLGVKIMF